MAKIRELVTHWEDRQGESFWLERDEEFYGPPVSPTAPSRAAAGTGRKEVTLSRDVAAPFCK